MRGASLPILALQQGFLKLLLSRLGGAHIKRDAMQDNFGMVSQASRVHGRHWRVD